MSKSPTGAPRRVAVGLLAGALSVFGIALAPQAGAVEGAVFDRVAGATRYGTAGAVSTEAYPDGNDCVIIATGERFPDSLAASGLAGAMDCPILLVQQDSITEETAAAIDELGATEATIVGGPAAVSEEVEEALAADHGLSVDRIQGVDRYETASLIAAAIDDIAESDMAIVASGEVAADAQSAGPIAASQNAPILLARTDELPATSATELAGRGVVLVAGGTQRISNETEADIEEASDDADAQRLAGLDRQETAAIIAEWAVDNLGWAPEGASLAAPNAPNDDFSPDALVAGPLGGIRQYPTLIVDGVDALGPDAEGFLDAHSNTIEEILCIGGTAVLSEELCTAAQTAARNTENDPAAAAASETSVLAGPELQDCRVAGIDTEDLIIVYRYEFDQDVDGDSVDASLFKLYDADNHEASTGDTSGEDPDVDGTNVDITYSLFDANVLTASLCAVEDGAVEDEDQNANPPQSLAVGSDRSGTGNTVGPDLIDAAVTEGEDEDDELDEWEVTYTFDSPLAPDLSELGGSADTLADERFQIVLRDGQVISASECETAPEADEASATVECTFLEEDFDDEDADTGDIARAVALEGAYFFVVGPGVAPSTVTQAHDIRGNSEAPDLASITTDAADSQATFRFDEDIDTVSGSAADFSLYFNDCDGAGPLSAHCVVYGESVVEIDEESVTIQFEEDVINDFLAGASVLEGAVTDADDGLVNGPDEVGLPTEFESGVVAGPQLDNAVVTVKNGTDGFFNEFRVTFTFTEDLDEDDADVDSAGFAIWYEDEDGSVERLDLEGCEADDNVVVCSDDDPESDLGNAVVASVDFGAVQSDALYTLDEAEVSVPMPNVEGSFEVTVPDFDVDPDDL